MAGLLRTHGDVGSSRIATTWHLGLYLSRFLLWTVVVGSIHVALSGLRPCI